MIANFSDLKDKPILITGATRGIGKQIALSLAAQKANVIFSYRGDETRAMELKEEIMANGASACHALQFDITNQEQVKSSIETYLKEHGPIEGLVNNAGVSKDQLMMRIKPEDIDYILDINLKAPIFLTSLLSKNFLRAKHGSIVNISSIVGLMGNSAQTLYSASKAGLIGHTKSVAKELAPKGVRCNAVCPGFISTDMTQALPEKIQAEYKGAIALKEFGDAKDVANTTCFLLSQASGYITGEIIKVDGGLYI